MRLDLYTSKKLDISREKARYLILNEKVLVNGVLARKLNTKVKKTDEVDVLEDFEYVSRGGIKLQSAVKNFGIDIENKVCADIGASTGGFTDYLIQNGASRVYAIDIGKNELSQELKSNPKVHCLENTNINKLDSLPEKVDLIVSDLSWISIKNYVLSLRRFLLPGGEIIILLKPQYEVSKNRLWKGKVLKDIEKRDEVIKESIKWLEQNEFNIIKVEASELKGKEGNQEYFLYITL